LEFVLVLVVILCLGARLLNLNKRTPLFEFLAFLLLDIILDLLLCFFLESVALVSFSLRFLFFGFLLGTLLEFIVSLLLHGLRALGFLLSLLQFSDLCPCKLLCGVVQLCFDLLKRCQLLRLAFPFPFLSFFSFFHLLVNVSIVKVI